MVGLEEELEVRLGLGWRRCILAERVSVIFLKACLEEWVEWRECVEQEEGEWPGEVRMWRGICW